MDLNLLRTFVAVYETRSLTAAAARLYVTQPATSQAVARLRQAFDDPLFERSGRLMVPTPLAESLFPAFRDALQKIDRTIGSVHGFDPAASDRHFRIALSELGEVGYFPELLQAVRRVAPHVRIEAVPLDTRALPEWLAKGTIDLAVTSSPVAGEFESVKLKSQGYAVLMSERHPLAAKGIDLASYVAASHVTVSGDSGRPNLQAALARLGVTIDAPVTVTHFASLPPLLAGTTDLIATVPDTIASAWATSWPLAVRDLPFAVAGVEVSLFKRATTQHVAALDWIFDTVQRAVHGSPGDFSAIRADARRSRNG
ncbi:hypothetical protein ASD65_14870 [Microbacterium sp. Root61]|uniref:LysR family transcriptional regulator n=1 Tax=Microbacterium sp. Root61 TaxID=1736570 RepID=UPI0006F66672|nr:LysR family transcriptional regulator [Microbacterium sp. Root61]KRA25555.1 hypothetical protein ASD65_14870 [Microbacterium sp. Root61]